MLLHRSGPIWISESVAMRGDDGGVYLFAFPGSNLNLSGVRVSLGTSMLFWYFRASDRPRMMGPDGGPGWLTDIDFL